MAIYQVELTLTSGVKLASTFVWSEEDDALRHADQERDRIEVADARVILLELDQHDVLDDDDEDPDHPALDNG